MTKACHRGFVRRLTLDDDLALFLFDAPQIQPGNAVKAEFDFFEHGAGTLLRGAQFLNRLHAKIDVGDFLFEFALLFLHRVHLVVDARLTIKLLHRVLMLAVRAHIVIADTEYQQRHHG